MVNIKTASETRGCLYIADITHLDYPILISVQIISMPSQFDSHWVKRRCGIFSRIYSSSPPLLLERSCLYILKPSTWNCESGKLLSSLDSLIARKSTWRLLKVSCEAANFYLILFIFSWANMKLCWYFFRNWHTENISTSSSTQESFNTLSLFTLSTSSEFPVFCHWW